MALKLLFCILLLHINNISTIDIYKCCDDNKELQISKEEQYFCIPGSDSLPFIYSPQNRGLLKSIPKNWNVIGGTLPDCGMIKLKLLTNKGVQHNFFIMDGSGVLVLLSNSNKEIPPKEFCYNSNSVLYCPEMVPELPKVRKCCGKGAIYKETKKSCVPMSVNDYKIDIGVNKTLIDGFPTCDANYLIVGKLHEAVLNDNGSLTVPILKTILPEESFCLEHVLENAAQSASIFACHDHLPSSIAPPVVTSDSNGTTVDPSDIRFKLYPAGLLLSAIFLAATLAAGKVIPAAHHHVLHWRCQTNHIACLLVGDVLLAITQLTQNSISGGFCFTMAILMHFLFLAAFFWLNTMCFNIWWTFRDLRPGTLEKRQERCRLRLYGVYAWGVPFIIAMIALILEALPYDPEYNFLRPNYSQVCWFPDNMEILIYFYGPIGVLLFVNLLLFAATARELTCGLWKRELVKSTTERVALGWVCMKLVIVMGVSWITDVISWAVKGPQAFWYITDLKNTLHGVFIFIVVACQPQVWTAIKRVWCKRQSLAADITGNENHHSSSSHGLPSYGDSVTNHSVSNTTRTVPIETSC